MMEAVSTSETSANLCQTAWRNIPEDSHIQTRRRENQKSQPVLYDTIAASFINNRRGTGDEKLV
jgi:hypothetical protein